MVGVPDELERLWTPHRMAYVSGDTRPTGGYDKPEGCPFCRAPGLPLDDGLVVARGTVVYAVLNRFPYNPGHLLVCPYRHVADYTDLTPEETVEVARFSQTAMTVIRQVSGPAGFNLGLNQGGVAGAGIAAHLHQHVVPRWQGDSNFMPVIGRTKTLPQLLGDTRELLATAWGALPDPELAACAAAAPVTRSRRPRPDPVKTASARTASVKAASVKAASVKAASAKTTPVKAASVKAASVKAASVKAASAKTASAKTTPVKAAAARTAPVKGTSVKAAPAKTTPAKAPAPVKTDAGRSRSAGRS